MENYYLVTFIERFQKRDMSVFPTIFAEFEKLMHFFAARLHEDDAFQELSVFFVELLYKINCADFNRDESDTASRYICVCIRNKYISLSKRSDLINSKSSMLFDGIFEQNRRSQQDFALTQYLKEILCTLWKIQKIFMHICILSFLWRVCD